jgi:hypothetical protein
MFFFHEGRYYLMGMG